MNNQSEARTRHHLVQVNGLLFHKSSEKVQVRFTTSKELSEAFASKCTTLGLDRHEVWQQMMRHFLDGVYNVTNG